MKNKKLFFAILISLLIAILALLFFVINGIYQNERLFDAIENNDLEAAKTAIERGAWLNTTKAKLLSIIAEYDTTPLMAACDGGNEDMVRLLIDNGADINLMEHKSGMTPLRAALTCGKPNRFSLAKYLIEQGADIKSPTERSYNIFEQLLIKCFNIDVYKPLHPSYVYHTLYVYKNDDEQTAREGFELFVYFVEHDTNTTVYPNSYTILTLSAEYGNNNVIKYLIEEKLCDVNLQDDKGDTPLITAAKHNKRDTAELLLELGADKTLKDSEGKTALDHAVQNQNNEIIDLLTE